MVSSRLVFALVAVPLFAGAVVLACGDDGESKTVPTVEGGASSSGGSSGSSSGTSSSGSSGGGTEDDGGEDGSVVTGPCGTPAFGKPAVNFVDIVDASDNGAYQGGALGVATYDAVIAERSGGGPGGWRETFVAQANNRFARIRQNDNDGGGFKPVTYRSGTYSATDAGQILLTFDCAVDGDASITDPSDTFQYEVVTINGKTYFRYGAAFIRVWLERR
jgi:hypothetical protein